MRIVCIGDSITVGQHLIEGEKPWPFLLHGAEIIAHGVNGDTTRLALERFPCDVQQLEPDKVIIQFGHNDCNRWDTDRGLPRVARDAYQANLREMVRRCRQFDATPLLCTITPPDGSERYNQDVDRYNEALLVAAEVCDAELVDVRSAFLRVADRSTLLLPDGLHLSPEGHQLYAATVQDALVRPKVAA